MNDPEMLRQTYNMVLEMWKAWPALQGEVIAIKGEVTHAHHRLSKVESRVEDTGRHDIEKLEAELRDRSKEHRDDRTWVARNWVAVVIAVGLLILSTGCSIASTILVRKVFGV